MLLHLWMRWQMFASSTAVALLGRVLCVRVCMLLDRAYLVVIILAENCVLTNIIIVVNRHWQWHAIIIGLALKGTITALRTHLPLPHDCCHRSHNENLTKINV